MAPNQPVEFEGKVYTNPKATAARFMRQYAPPPRSGKVYRKVKRNLKKLNLDQNYKPFTPEATSDAIKHSKNSTATGPDGLAPWHFKRLGPKGIEYLTATFNLSIATAEIPSVWKLAIVIPVLKPGKAPHLGTSYRPISLLCPAVKVLERLLLPTLNKTLVPSDHQHGFRRQRSTVTALLPIATTIADGMKQPKPPRRAAAVSVDISKAFDRVNIPLLLDEICQSGLHHNVIRWLRSYLR